MVTRALGENLQFAFLISKQISSCFENFKYNPILKKPSRWNFYKKYPKRKKNVTMLFMWLNP
jgi:hypothetical protein